MLGAGYPGNAKNLQGNTPLHLLAMNTSDPESASLCASLLCLRYPNLWKIYNNRGLASIHVAAQCGNAGVLEAMGSHGADMTFKTMDGQSLTDIAREYDHPEILKLLSNATSNHMARKRLSMGSQLHYTPAPPKEVDMERIMQVWDRFFENAFRMAEQREAEKHIAKQQQVKASKKSKRRQQFEEKEFEEDRYSRSGGNHIYSSPHTTAYSTSSNNHVYDWVEDKPYISSVYEAKHDEVDDQVDAVYYECLDWFQHVLFHSATHNEYFIVHLHSGASYWLADYYEFLTTGVMADYYRFLVDDVDILAAYSLPTNLLIGAQLGWMVCYDSQGIVSLSACRWCCRRLIMS